MSGFELISALQLLTEFVASRRSRWTPKSRRRESSATRHVGCRNQIVTRRVDFQFQPIKLVNRWIWIHVRLYAWGRPPAGRTMYPSYCTLQRHRVKKMHDVMRMGKPPDDALPRMRSTL